MFVDLNTYYASMATRMYVDVPLFVAVRRRRMRRTMMEGGTFRMNETWNVTSDHVGRI